MEQLHHPLFPARTYLQRHVKTVLRLLRILGSDTVLVPKSNTISHTGGRESFRFHCYV